MVSYRTIEDNVSEDPLPYLNPCFAATCRHSGNFVLKYSFIFKIFVERDLIHIKFLIILNKS
jgi:hypothetical protein